MLLVVFTGRCTTCALETHLATAKALERAIQRRAKEQGSTPTLLFTTFFNPHNIRARVTALGFTTTAYQALTDLRAIDALAERDAVDVFVIETDAAGRVAALSPINNFVQALVEVKQ